MAAERVPADVVRRAKRLVVTITDPDGAEHTDIALVDVCLEGGREGIETARWLRDVCGASVVFVTACNDEPTIERIHDRVPGAPVLASPASNPDRRPDGSS